MDIAINETNRNEIVAALVKAAGRATYATIRDWDTFETAFRKVLLDLERRFCVPDDVDLRAIFTPRGGYAKITELTFRRARGVWYLEKAKSKRASCAIDWTKYLVNPYAYEKFWLHVKDGRSMQSVDLDYGEPLSAHEQLAAMALEDKRFRSRRRRRRNE